MGSAGTERDPDDHLVLRFFGWASPFLLVAAYLSAVLLPGIQQPDDRGAEGLIAVPLLLGVLSLGFAAPAVVLTFVALARRRALGARELVPAAWSALVLFGLGGWLVLAALD